MQNRSAIGATLLSMFVPFYIFYWMNEVTKTVSVQIGQRKVRVELIVIALVLIIIAVLASSIVGQPYDPATEQSLPAANIMSALIGFVAVVLYTVSIPYVYFKFSSQLQTLDSERFSSVMVLLMLFLFSPIAVYYVQDGLNKRDQGQPPQQPLPQNNGFSGPTPS